MKAGSLTTVVCVSLLCTGSARAQVPQLVRDINPTADPAPSTNPSEITAALGSLFYVGEGAPGALRRMDGSGAVTILLSAEATELTPSGSSLFFVVDDDALYRTDGTPTGTLQVRRFPADILHSLTPVNGLVFFARYVAGPEELWRSDGTDTGTISLEAPNPQRLTAAGNRLFFFRDTPATGRELWSSDGTVAGTQMVADICPGPCSGVAVDDEMEALGAYVYFAGDDGVRGDELWRSDGTAAGTTLVRDSAPGQGGLGPRRLSAFGSRLLFTSDATLWISDGTSAGTFTLRSGLAIRSTIHDAGGVALFGASVENGPINVHELWKTDGTPAGTRAVTSGCNCSSVGPFGTLASVTVYANEGPQGSGLWRTDGTAAGTQLIPGVATPGLFERLGNALYFPGFDAANGVELWRTDGTASGTVRVTNRVDSSSYPQPFASLGQRLFFTATRPDIGRELWSTTGTSATTSFVELNPGPGSSFVGRALPLGESVIFGLHTGSGGLWTTDGTTPGTFALRTDLGVTGFARAGDVALVAGGGPNGGNVEPWRTDGTPAGTFRLADLNPGGGSSSPGFLASFGDRAVFTLADLGHSVWSTDGTPEGTYRVTPRPCWDLTPADDKLFMTCWDAVTGTDPWVSDGTESGTRLVRDLSTGSLDQLVAVEGLLYFKDGVGALWRSDGTEAGTQKVQDLVGLPIGTAVQLIAANGVLFFMGHMEVTGYELWRTDGTPSGTFMVRDIWPGPESGFYPGGAGGIVSAGGRVVFTAYNPATGSEAWLTDGTTAGTIPLEIVPGPASSTPYWFAYAAGRVHFSADDAIMGWEPWMVEMPAGAVSVGDVVLHEGDAGVTNAVFEVALESPLTSVLTVSYATAAGTAQAGGDFTPQSGTLTFAPGVVSATVSVPVLGDLQDESNETFTLELTSPVSAADRRGVALVLDDDGPTATITSVAVTEGNAGFTDAPFAVTLTTKDGNATSEIKTVGFATASWTATAGPDYVANAGTMTFAAGTASGATSTLHVAVVGDTIDEPNETFLVRLSPTSDVAVPRQPASGLIRDDDGIAAAPPLELTHGAMVRATLAPPPGQSADRDWYVLQQQPQASYELVIDETSGDAIPLQVERMAADGVTVMQSAVATGTGGALSLRWENTGDVAIADQALRVGSSACGTSCGTDDGYRVRLYETTLSGPRINNSGSQLTVVMLQNTASTPIAGRLCLWASYASSPTVLPFQLAPRQLLVLNTAPSFSISGSITVTHDGPYGALVGKTVALEPSTGFSFDTLLTPRAR